MINKRLITECNFRNKASMFLCSRQSLIMLITPINLLIGATTTLLLATMNLERARPVSKLQTNHQIFNCTTAWNQIQNDI